VVESDDRDGLREHLAAAGVATGIHYPIPIHRTAAYQGATASLPVAERLASRICSLPMHPAMTESDVERVADAVAAFAR
jgi:dTDP-4-amino-4,6-dideoxygalactose transaminase